MRYEKLGTSGLNVSKICLGTMTYGQQNTEAEGHEQLQYALEQGVNFLDTAELYAVPARAETQGLTEQYIGSWLKQQDRESIILATKIAGARPFAAHIREQLGFARQHLIDAVDASLRRLGTDYIDLYQLHVYDHVTPVEETMTTLAELVRAGKIRYLGCSNYSGWHLMKALACSEHLGLPRFVAHQAYYALSGRDYEQELMPLAKDQGVGTVVWSPLGWGRLTGKVRRDQPLPETSRLNSQRIVDAGPQIEDEYLYTIVDALDGVAKDVGKTVPQVALNWLLQRPTVATLIIGARTTEQLRDNLGAVGWNLSAEHVERLEKASDRPLNYPYWHQQSFSRSSVMFRPHG